MRVRRRPGWYDLSDEGAAVRAAGAPAGWHAEARRIVREVGLNVNRTGAITVSVPERRAPERLGFLEARLAETSLAVYEALLELDE